MAIDPYRSVNRDYWDREAALNLESWDVDGCLGDPARLTRMVTADRPAARSKVSGWSTCSATSGSIRSRGPGSERSRLGSTSRRARSRRRAIRAARSVILRREQLRPLEPDERRRAPEEHNDECPFWRCHCKHS
jgi:hypothetical protein